ncbi:hypothetical protein DVH07_06340 [Hafnia paralvei]|nr:hypothetical protein DU449_07650 [Hafnia paralvei]RDA69353.1 hypothetical protein DVH09_08245 [Hafnia paralvei]RDA69514.1 hypothetical protein DVH08_09240 [Hafnia paralvei]RDA79557.1 hypothetical protein DVH10_06630 [Hafnia paralvei]RDA80094.1 hypothetical protein DVH07_06340 [Hafnia paralvei]
MKPIGGIDNNSEIEKPKLIQLRSLTISFALFFKKKREKGNSNDEINPIIEIKDNSLPENFTS